MRNLCASVIEQLAGICGFEILLADDSDAELSWQSIMALVSTSAYISAIRLSKNFGQHCAIFAGLQYASGELIMTMDDDGQHDPKDLRKMLVSMSLEFDVIYAYSER